MSLAIGIGGGNPTSGGGAPSLTDPSSFADAKLLLLGDRGMTFDGHNLDIWANQGTEGGSLSAVTSGDTIPTTANRGIYDYIDLQPWGTVNFNGSGFETTSTTEFTFETVQTVHSNWNPGRIGPSIGDGNAAQYPCLLWVGSQGIRVTQKTGGGTTNTYWSKAACGFEYGQPIGITIVYNGAEAVNADRLKLYVNGVFVASTTTPTHPTSVQNINGEYFVTSYSTSYSTFQGIGGYIGYWTRVLTGDEISANQTWKNKIWRLS